MERNLKLAEEGRVKKVVASCTRHNVNYVPFKFTLEIKKKKNLLEVTRRHESPIKFLVLRERAFTQRRRNVIIHNTEPEVTQN